MILYFSGTGNSKYIADILSKKLNDEKVCVNELLKNNQKPFWDGESPLIFVSPVYAWRLPKVFQNYIASLGYKAKAYFVLTCGDSICNAQKYITKFCKATDFELMGVAEIVMPENYIAMFSAPPKDKIPRIIAIAEIKAERLAKVIKDGKALAPVKTNLLGKFLSSFIVNGGFYTFCVSAKKFYATDKCNSCGLCVKNCPLNNIKLANGKPVWAKNCTHCMACICRCPTSAIEYGKKTKNKDRYVCPKN